MPNVTRWLTWNGLYTHVGGCNKKFDALGTEAGTKQRLRAMGFGWREDAAAFKQVVARWNALADPAIPSAKNKGAAVQRTDVVPPLGSAAATKLDEYAARSRGRRPGAVSAAQPLPVPQFAAPTSVSSRRSAQTLNVDTTFGVALKSVPKDFNAHTQIACLELELRGAEKIQSLMLRIYRNVKPADQLPVVLTARRVYQEVLRKADLDDLRATMTHDHNVVPQDPVVRQLLVDNLALGGGGASGAFDKIGNLNNFWHRVHCPYLVAVWVSDDPAAFDGHEARALNPPEGRGFPLHESMPSWPPGYLKRVLDDPPPRPDPGDDAVLDELENVADKTDDMVMRVLAANMEEHAPRITVDWHALRSARSPRQVHNLVHLKPKLGVTLMGQPCKTHDHVNFHRSLLRTEEFGREVYRQPLEIYTKLRESALEAFLTQRKLPADQQVGFAYDQLGDTFANIERHLNIVEQRVCCGEWADLPKAAKKDIAKACEAARADIAEERELGFRYKPSMRIVFRTVRFFNELIAWTRGESEYSA
jgi:hypothetical protein